MPYMLQGKHILKLKQMNVQEGLSNIKGSNSLINSYVTSYQAMLSHPRIILSNNFISDIRGNAEGVTKDLF